ncbi:hypothetical protein HDU85_005821 [Gaertneriomyces sp. JEL0708]|nr:hypothetical protein HDU85_005821 [Gaertneriomyces sp. JEL0708]
MGLSQEQSAADSRESTIPRNLATSQIFIPTNDFERPVLNSADFDTFEIPPSGIFDASERTSYEIQLDAPARASERRASSATAPTKKHGFICRIQRLFRACLPTSGKRSSTYKTSPSSNHSTYMTAN